MNLDSLDAPVKLALFATSLVLVTLVGYLVGRVL